MVKRIKKIDELESKDLDIELKGYKYQPKLTPSLDRLAKVETSFDQNIINEIVLWKVNRYAKLSDGALPLINKISIRDDRIDEDLTRLVLRELLKIDGMRLAMASTILRFKNPKIYQIIDQRIARLFYHDNNDESKKQSYLKHLGDLKRKKEESKDAAIAFYLEYLEKIRSECKRLGFDFKDADRVLYLADISFNPNAPISY